MKVTRIGPADPLTLGASVPGDFDGEDGDWETSDIAPTLPLDNLVDVNAPAPADGDVLTWDDYLQQWVAGPASSTLALDDLTDVLAPTPGDGDLLSWDSGTAAWVPVAPPSGTVPDGIDPGDLLVWDGDYGWSVLPVGGDDEVLTADSGETLGVKWAPAGGGSTFDAKPFIWTPAASPTAYDDEFNDATGMSGPTNGLDARWSKHNLGTASWVVMDDTVGPGALVMNIPTAQSVDQSIYQAVPAGDFTITTRMSYAAGDRQMWGIFIVSTTGAGISLLVDNGDDTIYLRELSAWAQTGNVTAVTYSNPLFARTIGYMQPITLLLRKESGVYYGGVAFDPRIVKPYEAGSRTPTAFTAAYMGVGRVHGSGFGFGTFDSFRKIA